jgi:hypothetical protein
MHVIDVLAAGCIGLGATVLIDLWGLFLRRAFGIASLDICLLGRWALHVPDGKFLHDRIAMSPRKRYECLVGWTAHYSIGATFAIVFVALASRAWLSTPTLLPALVFGVATVLVPFFTVQPAFGLGVASSKTQHPFRARLKSTTTHAVFGVGLWLSAFLLSSAERWAD